MIENPLGSILWFSLTFNDATPDDIFENQKTYIQNQLQIYKQPYNSGGYLKLLVITNSAGEPPR